MLACGMDPKGVMAELTGRRGGYSKGKGGSMHMFSVEKHFYGGHGIVGAQVSLGTGLAFANRYRGNDNVCLTYFGDGAANQGQVYESFNMAELWKLPVIYVIENNRYAMGTSVSARLGADRFLQARRLVQHSRRAGRRHGRARGQGRAATRRSQWCRAGKGPYILEMQTYRYRGHSMSDPAKYRTTEEVEKMRAEQRSDRAGARSACSATAMGERGRAEEDRRRGPRDRQRGGRVRDHDPEPDPSELWTDVSLKPSCLHRHRRCLRAVASSQRLTEEPIHADRNSDARAVARPWRRASSPSG